MLAPPFSSFFHLGLTDTYHPRNRQPSLQPRSSERRFTPFDQIDLLPFPRPPRSPTTQTPCNAADERHAAFASNSPTLTVNPEKPRAIAVSYCSGSRGMMPRRHPEAQSSRLLSVCCCCHDPVLHYAGVIPHWSDLLMRHRRTRDAARRGDCGHTHLIQLTHARAISSPDPRPSCLLDGPAMYLPAS